MPLDFPDSPALDEIFDNWMWDGEKWVAIGTTPMLSLSIAAVFPGPPDAGMRILIPLAYNVSIPANLAGSVGDCVTPPTAAATFGISTLSGTALGQATIGTNGGVSFSGSGGVIAVGDALLVQPPLAQDVTLDTVGLTIFAAKI